MIRGPTVISDYLWLATELENRIQEVSRQAVTCLENIQLGGRASDTKTNCRLGRRRIERNRKGHLPVRFAWHTGQSDRARHRHDPAGQDCKDRAQAGRAECDLGGAGQTHFRWHQLPVLSRLPDGTGTLVRPKR